MNTVPVAVVADAARRYGAEPAALRPFAPGRPGADGELYRYQGAAGACLLKVVRLQPEMPEGQLKSVQARLDLMRHLDLGGARVPRPLPSLAGRLSETLSTDDKRYVAYSMPFLPGRTPDARDPAIWNERFFHRWGALVGRTHHLATTYPTWRSMAGNDDPPDWMQEIAGFRRWCRDEEIQGAWDGMREKLAALPVERESYGFVQNDPHPWNLLIHEDTVTLLDFDVACCQFFMTDIGTAVYGASLAVDGGDAHVSPQPLAATFLESFREGYEGEHHLSEVWWDRLGTFLSYRRLLLFTVMYDEVSRHPSFVGKWKRAILEDAAR